MLLIVDILNKIFRKYDFTEISLNSLTNLEDINLNQTIRIFVFSLLPFSFNSVAADKLENIKLNRILGTVMINAAGQYKPVTNDTLINSDTKILIGKSSSAQLVYPSGCAMNIQGDKIFAAGIESNCKSGSPILVATNDNVVAIGDNPKEVLKEDNTNTLLMLGGAGLLAIGAAAAAFGSNNTPSP
jgi:hypothetical protein